MKGFLILAAAATLFSAGCAKLAPRLNEKIDNQNGKIDEIKNNQNGVNLELGKLRQNSEIQNSNVKDMQQGMLNLNAAVSKNDNSGVQILQGDGALVLIFGIAVVGMVLYHFRKRAVQGEKAADIMAAEIARFNHPDLNDAVLKAAMNTDQEQHVFHLLTKKSR